MILSENTPSQYSSQGDYDHSGLVSIERLVGLLSTLGLVEVENQSRLAELLRKADNDRDGKISFEGFKNSFLSLLPSDASEQISGQLGKHGATNLKGVEDQQDQRLSKEEPRIDYSVEDVGM